MDVFRVPILVGVNFVGDFEFVSPRLHGGMLRVVNRDDHMRAVAPGMNAELGPQHLSIGRLLVQRVGGGVGADEAVPLLLQPVVEEIVESFLGDRQRFGVQACLRVGSALRLGVEKHEIVVGQLFLGENPWRRLDSQSTWNKPLEIPSSVTVRSAVERFPCFRLTDSCS